MKFTGKIGSASTLTLVLATVAALSVAIGAPAQTAAQTAPQTLPPPPARGPSSALALEAAQAAISSCEHSGYSVAVTVVNSAGDVRLVLASDAAPQRAVESSGGKALTVITYKLPSGTVAQRAASDPALAARIAADPRLRARAGALPLTVGSDLIGAIGVGGAPGGEKDEACAAAGIEKIKARLK
jgi:uncharacterized protein GlcG (DUF336 family)